MKKYKVKKIVKIKVKSEEFRNVLRVIRHRMVLKYKIEKFKGTSLCISFQEELKASNKDYKEACCKVRELLNINNLVALQSTEEDEIIVLIFDYELPNKNCNGWFKVNRDLNTNYLFIEI